MNQYQTDTTLTLQLPYFGGRYYFTFPDDGYLYLLNYKLWGAGGGAGGADSHPGGNGAGGGFVEGSLALAPVPGQLVEVFVGGGGGHGVSGSNAVGGENGKSLTGFSGGSGGNSGPGGWSGSGGAGGGATVIRINGDVRVIAGAGGGGGGGGNYSNGVSAGGTFNHLYKHDVDIADQGKGWHGLSHYGDGGGGGGGGGGSAGGGPGDNGGGDSGGAPGACGTNADGRSGPGVYGSGIVPGGIDSVDYPGDGVGYGGEVNNSASVYSNGGTNGAWSSLLNNYCVWNGNGEYNWYVNFSSSGTYYFDLSVDNYGTMFIDDSAVVYAPSYGGVWTESRFVTAGWHKITITATNTGGPGGIGARIRNSNDSTIWTGREPRDPRTSGYGPTGGPGYCQITLVRSSDFFVKANGEYKRVIPKYRLGSAYNTKPNTFVKINGEWKSVLNDLSVNVSQDYMHWGDAGYPEPPQPIPQYDAGAVGDGGGGWDGSGGGGGGSVICTALYELGHLEQEIFEWDQKYGEWLLKNHKETYIGYRLWADVLVNYMHGRNTKLYVIHKLMFWKKPEEVLALKVKYSQKVAVGIANIVAKPFAYELARRYGHNTKFSLPGYLIVSAGLVVCKIIGKVHKLSKRMFK